MKQIVLCVLLLCISCNRESCKTNLDLQNDFKRAIRYLTKTEKIGAVYDHTYKIKAIFFMYKLTGIESNISLEHTTYWGDKKLLNEDIEKWFEWYEANQCMDYDPKLYHEF